MSKMNNVFSATLLLFLVMPYRKLYSNFWICQIAQKGQTGLVLEIWLKEIFYFSFVGGKVFILKITFYNNKSLILNSQSTKVLYLCDFFLFIFSALLKYNLYTIGFTNLKYSVQQALTSILSNVTNRHYHNCDIEHFHHSIKFSMLFIFLISEMDIMRVPTSIGLL